MSSESYISSHFVVKKNFTVDGKFDSWELKSLDNAVRGIKRVVYTRTPTGVKLAFEAESKDQIEQVDTIFSANLSKWDKKSYFAITSHPYVVVNLLVRLTIKLGLPLSWISPLIDDEDVDWRLASRHALEADKHFNAKATTVAKCELAKLTGSGFCIAREDEQLTYRVFIKREGLMSDLPLSINSKGHFLFNDLVVDGVARLVLQIEK